jgi:hypothetical protein
MQMVKIASCPTAIAGFVFLCMCSCHTGSPPGQKLISVPELQKDFEILTTTLQEVHTGLYEYNSAAEWKQYIDSAKERIQDPMNELAFFKLLVPVIAHIRCLHTNISPSEDTRKILGQTMRCLPVSVRIIHDKIYVSQCLQQNSSGIIGSELMFIDDQPAHKVIATLKTFLPADGYNETHKNHLLQTSLFREAYALFIDQRENFRLRVKKNGVTKEFLLNAVSETQAQEPDVNRPLPFISLAFVNGSVAVITVRTMVAETGQFSDSLRSIFTRIQRQGCKSLIIDIRDNGGGNDANVRNLYAWVATGAFKQLQSAVMLNQRFQYLRYCDNASEFTAMHGIKTSQGYNVNYRYPGTAVTLPKADGFKGRIYVLFDGGTASAASELAALLKSNQRAVCIGEEAGGNYYGATGGVYAWMRLPASGLKIRIPAIRIYTDVKSSADQPPGRGCMPDYTIVPTMEEWLAHSDPQMDLALKLAANTIIRR